MSSVAVLSPGDSRAGDDEAVLVRAALTDPRAFGELYERYVDRVYQYLRVRTDTEEDAADLTQQTFMQALDALPKYRERGAPFSAWLFRIAHNAVVDSRRRRRHTVTWDAVPEAGIPTSEHDVEALVLARDNTARLQALIDTLDPDQRDLIALRFVAGLTMQEIAVVVRKSDSTVHRRLTQALGLLKERSRER